MSGFGGDFSGDFMRGAMAAARLVEPIRAADAVLPEDATDADIIQTIQGGVQMDFGTAITAMKNGARVSRAGWNGKGMWLEYASSGVADLGPEGAVSGVSVGLLPFIVMKTANEGEYVPWLASQTDMLATDWGIVE